MARNFYLSELDFRNLTTVKGISVDLISQISGISPSTIRKAVRENKIDKLTLEYLAKAICSLIQTDTPFLNASTYKSKSIRKYNVDYDIASKKYFSFPNNKLQKYQLHEVQRRLSPNYFIKECSLDLATSENFSEFTSFVESADILRLGTNIEFSDLDQANKFKNLVKIIEEYLEGKRNNEAIDVSVQLSTSIISNLDILNNIGLEDKLEKIKKEAEEIVNKMNLYFSNIKIFAAYDKKDKKFIKINIFQDIARKEVEDIIIFEANHLIISTKNNKEVQSIKELVDTD